MEKHGGRCTALKMTVNVLEIPVIVALQPMEPIL
jgi:hypothetical protein